jgi:hypothetical protein
MRNIKKRWIILVMSILFLGYVSLFGSFLIQKEYWKNLLFQNTEKILGYKIKYSSEDISFFPSPSLSLYDIHIENKSNNFSIFLNSDRATVQFSWSDILINKWRIDTLEIENSKINLQITEPLKSNNNSFSVPDQLKNLQITNTIFKNVQLNLNFNSKDEVILIHSLDFKHKSMIKNFLSFKLDYSGGSTTGNLELGLESIFKSLDDLIISGSINLKNFPIKVFHPYYKFLRLSNFQNSYATGELIINKNTNSEIELSTKLSLINLNFTGLSFSSPPLEINSTMTYLIKHNKLIFLKTSIKHGNHLNAKIKGDLVFSPNILLQLEIKGEYLEFEKTLEYILAFTKISSNSSNPKIKFLSELKLNFQKISFKDYNFGDSTAEIKIDEKNILLNILKSTFYDGVLTGDGIIDTSELTTYDITFRIENLNLPNFIERFSNKKFITGKLDTDFHFHSIGTQYSDIEKNLKIRGFANIKEGKLFGYANFLEPIFALGKLVNFLGPKGDSSAFKSIQAHFYLENKIIDIPDLKMTGVGIDATGLGKVQFDSTIDFRIIVGFGGIAGKALSIPILYKGYLTKNAAYIDPIWLGSVYLGITLAGPAGVTVGGIAGSMATEYIHNGINSIKNLFKQKADSQENKEE